MSVSQWRDKQGRAWSFRITIGDAKRLKAAGCDIGDAQKFQQLFANALSLIEMVTELLRPQWEKLELTAVQFEELLTEDVGTIEEIRSCFQEGLRDFFLRIGDKATARIVDMAAEAAELHMQAITKRAESSEIKSFLERAMEKDESDYRQRLAAEGAKLFGTKSTSVPESLASIQTLGPAES